MSYSVSCVIHTWNFKYHILNLIVPSENNSQGTVVILLGEPKYGPGSEPNWKAGSAHYPAFYKALLDELLRTKRIKMVRDRGISSSTRNQ